jgi:hypothetical protein
MTMKMISVGECPVCPGFGAVLALGVVGEHRLVYFCPACEGAWLVPPGPGLDRVNRVSELAPQGVRRPSQDESAKLRGAVEVDVDAWADELHELLI